MFFNNDVFRHGKVNGNWNGTSKDIGWYGRLKNDLQVNVHDLLPCEGGSCEMSESAFLILLLKIPLSWEWGSTRLNILQCQNFQKALLLVVPYIHLLYLLSLETLVFKVSFSTTTTRATRATLGERTGGHLWSADAWVQ